MAATDAVASASGSATTLVALGGLRDRALELSRLTAVHAFPAADQKEQLKDFQNKQCTDAVKAKDFAGFIRLIMSHSDALFAAGNDETTSGYFTLTFSFLRDISSSEQHDAVVQDIISLLSGSQDNAELRLNILADLYNTLAPGDARFALFLGIIRYAVATQLVELLAPFFGPAAAGGAKSLTQQQHRTLLQEISAALDAAGLTDEAQQYRIAFLQSLQGADAATLAAASDDAVKAATGYFKAPVVSQKSNLPVLDAVVALKDSPQYARVYQLLNIFAAGRVSDFTAFVGTGDNKAWMGALGVNVEGSERTVRLLTLASLASTSNQISYATVAEALQVPEADAEAWVVDAVGRGLLDAKCSQETKTVTVSRSIAREFGDAQWTALAGKLNAWRDNIDGVLTRMRSARMESSL